jgi:RNA methyltransferase, TrmH family
MEARKITSPSNRLVKQTADIAMRKRRADDRFFIAEGPNLVISALAAACPVREIFYTPEYARTAEGKAILLSLADAESLPEEVVEVSGSILSKMSDAESPQGILAVVAVNDIALDKLGPAGTPLVAVCDGIGDPGNLGTIIRIADAAGADAVLVLPDSCDPYSPKAVRATAGSIFNLPVVRAGREELVDYLAERSIRLYAADVRAEKSLYETDLTLPCAVVFGNEARGVSGFVLEHSAGAIRIPMAGRAESLNAAVSAAICLYEAVRQRSDSIARR